MFKKRLRYIIKLKINKTLIKIELTNSFCAKKLNYLIFMVVFFKTLINLFKFVF